ncbi:hypothetical protein WBP07_23840 [Novosphingobium sp. BL-8A]|uniref:hypothetical protein n=1 Tax=Novosphingobium sp. BL-8A TaxID=3127639 RepID=UPI003756444F
MRWFFLVIAVLGLSPASAHAQASPDEAMAKVAEASPLFQRARRTVIKAAGKLQDAEARRLTQGALLVPGDCVRHRIGLDREAQRTIVTALAERGLLDGKFGLEEARAMLFPPLEGEDGACPHLAVPVLTAPGGNSGSHHSWPGGLAEHIATNLESGMALVRSYRSEGARIDGDTVAGAILWHDWAKALVLRWQANGDTAPELRVAGTGAHHILGLAEAMKRGLPPRWIVAQACAHAAPDGDDLARVSKWIEAAAMIAREDRARFPVLATPECLISHLSDQNWVFGDMAVAAAEARLAELAQAAGFAAGDRPRYKFCYRNVLLAQIGADALFTTGKVRASSHVDERINLCASRFGAGG